ncbi:unnamed protein product [Allacma fusca]|uniref:TIP41-like protein n=1 Tax=Allacma fusca TaxID=39272 RepID=A0A8J2KBE1_9HEXA|nr:unnamed protein product [Allacma fusca]
MSTEVTTGRSPTQDVVVNRQGEVTRRFINKQYYNFDGWTIAITKSTILPSSCYCHLLNKDLADSSIVESSGVQENGGGNGSLGGESKSEPQVCHVCRYNSELSITHLPEMIFPDNVLRVTFAESNFTLEFNALDALKLISNAPEALHVAFAKEWKAAQDGGPLPGEIRYDWTFSTDYKGTVTSQSVESQPDYRTEEKLNMEKLKQRENILFYEELSLYEDELHDNGTSNLSVKIRVMPSGFFILQRFFLRVDSVMAKICDTRVHYEAGNKYILREFQERKQAADKLSHLPPQTFTDANLLYPHLTVISEQTDKISLNLHRARH